MKEVQYWIERGTEHRLEARIGPFMSRYSTAFKMALDEQQKEARGTHQLVIIKRELHPTTADNVSD